MNQETLIIEECNVTVHAKNRLSPPLLQQKLLNYLKNEVFPHFEEKWTEAYPNVAEVDLSEINVSLSTAQEWAQPEMVAIQMVNEISTKLRLVNSVKIRTDDSSESRQVQFDTPEIRDLFRQIYTFLEYEILVVNPSNPGVRTLKDLENTILAQGKNNEVLFRHLRDYLIKRSVRQAYFLNTVSISFLESVMKITISENWGEFLSEMLHFSPVSVKIRQKWLEIILHSHSKNIEEVLREEIGKNDVFSSAFYTFLTQKEDVFQQKHRISIDKWVHLVEEHWEENDRMRKSPVDLSEFLHYLRSDQSFKLVIDPLLKGFFQSNERTRAIAEWMEAFLVFIEKMSDVRALLIEIEEFKPMDVRFRSKYQKHIEEFTLMLEERLTVLERIDRTARKNDPNREKASENHENDTQPSQHQLPDKNSNQANQSTQTEDKNHPDHAKRSKSSKSSQTVHPNEEYQLNKEKHTAPENEIPSTDQQSSLTKENSSNPSSENKQEQSRRENETDSTDQQSSPRNENRFNENNSNAPSTHHGKPKVPDLSETPIIVPNAGMVLLHPFLPTLFRNFELVDEKHEWYSLEHQRFAVEFIHFLATNSWEHTEDELIIGKLLTGLPLFPSEGEEMENASEDEKDNTIHSQKIAEQREKLLHTLEVEEDAELLELITALRQNWRPMRNCTWKGLRKDFLTREGTLTQKETTANETPTTTPYELIVEPQTLDLLLPHKGWSVSRVKYSWMPSMINVEWEK